MANRILYEADFKSRVLSQLSEGAKLLWCGCVSQECDDRRLLVADPLHLIGRLYVNEMQDGRMTPEKLCRFFAECADIGAIKLYVRNNPTELYAEVYHERGKPSCNVDEAGKVTRYTRPDIPDAPLDMTADEWQAVQSFFESEYAFDFASSCPACAVALGRPSLGLFSKKRKVKSIPTTPKTKKQEMIFPPDSFEYKIALKFKAHKESRENVEPVNETSLQSWAKEIYDMMRLDNRSPAQVTLYLNALLTDDFYGNKVKPFAPKKFRQWCKEGVPQTIIKNNASRNPAVSQEQEKADLERLRKQAEQRRKIERQEIDRLDAQNQRIRKALKEKDPDVCREYLKTTLTNLNTDSREVLIKVRDNELNPDSIRQAAAILLEKGE